MILPAVEGTALARPSQMSLVAFLQASNVSVYSGSWRYPSATDDFGDLRHYARIARVLEEGTFDLMFFDDRLAMPAIYDDSTDDAVRYGARPVKLDLAAVLGGCAAVTDRLGLGATYSTTYYPPFHVARTFATLDQLTRGRSAWNIVTSINDAEARNFGQEIHLGHDERYDRAEEFVDVVRRLWDSWEDDALVQDRESGIFADPAKVHELHHHGEYFDVRGPLTVPRSPQGRPVLLQAGSSGRGREFAARHAELIFTADPSREVAVEHYADQRERIAAAGRDPDEVRILPMAYTVVGETETIAREKEAILLDQLVHPMASLTLLSELLNHDFAGHALDDEVTDELLSTVSGLRGLAEGVRRHTVGRDGAGEPLTLRTLAAHRATLLQGPRFVGTGDQVAEQMHEWFSGSGSTGPACDGFVLAATHFPGSFEDVTRMVVPALRRRGVFRHAYPGTTLRETLGLARPERVAS